MYTADAKYFNDLCYLETSRVLLIAFGAMIKNLKLTSVVNLLSKTCLKCIAEISIFVCARLSESGHLQSHAPGIPRDLYGVGSSSPQFRYIACLSAMCHTSNLWAMSIKCGFAFS